MPGDFTACGERICSIKTRNPNPLPTGIKFGFLQYERAELSLQLDPGNPDLSVSCVGRPPVPFMGRPLAAETRKVIAAGCGQPALRNFISS